MKHLKLMIGAIMALMMSAGMATAQGAEAVAQNKDWSIFKQGSGAGRMCWIVSKPISSTATRGGAPVAVRRGEIYLMVAIRPGERVKNEVSMISGYPFRPDSAVKVDIGGKPFEMFTEGEGAWTDSPERDDALVAAMRAGNKAVLTGTSSRGTVTRDEFSLLGFTAALREAGKLCA